MAKSYRLTFRSLKPIGETKQIVGVAVAVNGKMLSVEWNLQRCWRTAV